MVFSSTVFVFLFLPIVLLIYYNPFLKNRKFKNIFLFFASLLFYAWGEPIYVFLLISSIGITWFLGIKIVSKDSIVSSRAYLVLGVCWHIIILFIFKYCSFLINQFGMLTSREFSNIDIVLPIGISFFTFQLLSYLFDVYQRKVAVQKNILYLGLYVALFPQLIAGPIVRYEQIALEIDGRNESWEDVIAGMKRFIYGLGKKVLLSNYLAVIADNIFDIHLERTVMTAWLGAIAYTLQIYFDFSGYSDMAIGLGRMFGFHFAENFRYPYIAKNVTDFWRRWHISLSSWFRDYVYIPLGGNRVSPKRESLNLFVVWGLTGIWHGANWTFLVWGVFYFIVLIFEKKTNITKKLGSLSYIYTIVIVIIAWVIFRSASIQEGLFYIGNMFGIGSTGIIDEVCYNYIFGGKTILTVSVICALPVYPIIYNWLQKKKLEIAEYIICVGVFVLSIFQVVASTYNPFIYFNF